MFQKPYQPIVTDRVEERTDIGIEHPVDPSLPQPEGERVQRVVLAASGPESVAESETQPRRSASEPPPPPPGRSYPPMRRCRAVAADHPPSVCTDDERQEPDTRPYGRVRKDSRGSSRGLPRNLPTIPRRCRGQRPSSV